MSRENLFVEECFANKGPTMKRVKPRAQGRAYRIEKIHDLREAKDPYSKKLLASVFTIEEGKNKVLPDELFN